MDAMLCRSCSWFGVYGADVSARVRACPVCGSSNVAIRDTEAEEWQELGRRLLADEPDEDQRARGAR